MLRKHVIHSSSQCPLNAYLVQSTGMLMKEGEKRGKENTRVGGGQDRSSGQRVWVLTGWLLSLSTVASISQICCPSGKI